MLSDHHEWLTAHTMLTLQIWESRNIKYFNAQPVINFQNIGDTGITQLGSLKGVCDNKGNGYYVSYPQFAFQFPYLILKLIHAKISTLNLEILNLFIHFISALFLFFLMIKMIESTDFIKFLAATFTFIVYIFSAGNLWFLQNVWFADTLVQLFLISTLLFYFLFEKTKKNRFQYLFFLSVFLMCITEWIGILFCFTFLCFQLYEIILQKKSTKIFIITLLIVIISISLIIIEYLSITSFNNLISFWKFRFLSRTFIPNKTLNEESFAINNYHSWQVLFDNYKLAFSVYIFIPFIAVISMLFCWYKFDKTLLNKTASSIILLLLFSILFHHFIFFSFTVEHDFSLLKDSILISLLAGISIYLLLNNLKILTTRFVAICLMAMLVIATYFSVQKYQQFNSNNCYPDHLFINISDSVNKNSTANDALFIMYKGDNTKWLETPQKYFYCQRNIQDISTEADAKAWLKKYNIKSGVIFIDSMNAISREIYLQNK